MENNSRSTAAIGPPRLVIEAAEAEVLAKKRGLTVPDLLPSLVPSAQAVCRVPISNYHVGAVGLGSSGRIFLGGNMEFLGVPLHQSIHAEQFLINNAAIHGEERLSHIAVSSVPCGHCRQFLQELRGASDIQILVTADGPTTPFAPLSSLLPHPFGPRDLLPDDAALLLEPQNNQLSLDDKVQAAICNGTDVVGEKLKAAALEAARKSRAPYSGCPAGFAVADGDGRVYVGSYAESAAYNPSLGPVQSALIAFVAGGGRDRDFGEITGAALVERGGGPVSQESTAKILLSAVAPLCRLQVYHCRVQPSA